MSHPMCLRFNLGRVALKCIQLQMHREPSRSKLNMCSYCVMDILRCPVPITVVFAGAGFFCNLSSFCHICQFLPASNIILFRFWNQLCKMDSCQMIHIYTQKWNDVKSSLVQTWVERVVIFGKLP
jgi:hypothetical protein